VLIRDPHPEALFQAPDEWSQLISYWDSKYGRNPVRNSIIWTRCAETIRQSDEFRSVFGDFRQSHALYRKDSPISKKIEELLSKAFQLDPNNETAWRKLLEHYQQTNHTAARNRLLDQLSKIHPNHKEVLFQNGVEAVKRKAFKKGLQSLRAAWALDPLDRKVKCELSAGLLLHIRDGVTKGRDDTLLWAELEPLLEASFHPEYLSLSRWLVSLSKAIRSDAPTEATAALAPSPIEHQFATFLLQQAAHNPPKATRWMSKWTFELNDLGINWQQCFQMLRLSLACCDRYVFGSVDFSQLETTLTRVTHHLIGSLTDNLSEMIGVFQSPAFETMIELHRTRVMRVFGDFQRELRKRYSGRVLSMDPHFRIAMIALALYTDLYVDPEEMQSRLSALLREGEAPSFAQHLPAIDILNKRAEKILQERRAGFPFFDDIWGDDDEEEDDYGDDDDIF